MESLYPITNLSLFLSLPAPSNDFSTLYELAIFLKIPDVSDIRW